MKKFIVVLSIVVMLAVSISIAVLAGQSNVNRSVALSSDSLEVLTSNTNFMSHDFEVKEMNESVNIDRTNAIEKANASTANRYSQATKITAVLVKFTDRENPKIPELGISLTDYPVWIVTFYEVNMQKFYSTKNSNILADTNIIIDANTGKYIASFSYKSIIK